MRRGVRGRYEGITQKLKWNLPIRGVSAGKGRPQMPDLPPPRTPEVASRRQAPAMARSADMEA